MKFASWLQQLKRLCFQSPSPSISSYTRLECSCRASGERWAWNPRLWLLPCISRQRCHRATGLWGAFRAKWPLGPGSTHLPKLPWLKPAVSQFEIFLQRISGQKGISEIRDNRLQTGIFERLSEISQKKCKIHSLKCGDKISLLTVYYSVSNLAVNW